MWCLVVLASVLTVGCKRGESDIDGFEKWRFGQTTAKDGVVCSDSGDLTFCSQNGPVQIAGFSGAVNLHFRGKGDDAPLIEIELAFSRCDPRKIAAVLMAELGRPSSESDNTSFWSGKKARVAARLPAKDGVCLIHFVSPEDDARWLRLKSTSGAPRP